MAFIRTNLQAGLISRQLAGINRQFTTNLERLSTGLRLNRPDDSPGQFGVVINQRLQLASLGQGIINAQNAAGMLQTAEEGIGSIIDLLNRAHDLAVTAADSTLTEAQRQQAQDEINEILTKSTDSELDLILKNVKFNGLLLLADSNQAAAIENSTLGLAGGNHTVDSVLQGGQFTNTLNAAGTAAFSVVDLATNAAADFTTDGNVDTKALAATSHLMTITLKAGVSDRFQVGDFLEINVTDLDAVGSTVQTFTDSVVVVNVNNATENLTVANARAAGSALNAGTFLAANFAAAGSDTINVKRLAQTLVVDSTGATATTSSDTSKTFDFRDPQSAVSFRNVLRVGVVRNPSSDSDATSATLGTVLVSFTETDPIAAAAQIQAAIENQLGGEYRSGGDFHIDVRAVTEVRKATAGAGGAGATDTNLASDALVGQTVDLSDTLFATSRTRFGTAGTLAALAGTFTDINAAATGVELSDEIADIQNVRFQFTTTKTAGVNDTPQLRIISDELAGFSGATKLFENLTVGTGQHGNDKLIITVDGEEVEADLDVAGATTSANAIVNTIATAEETARDTADSEATMMLSRVGFNVNEATGVVANATGAAAATSNGTAATANNLTYTIDEAATAGYFDPEAMRILIQDGINNATNFASDVNVAYDSSTRTFTTTTGSRGNTSTLTVGKSFGANQESTLMPSITDLVDTTGTTGFKGALGFNENAFSTGSGSVFTFRLGGDTDVFSITFDTLGQQNFGADLVDISSVNVATQGGAAAAITILEEALESVSTTQTKIGAGINHMQRRINVLETHREALQAQKARIEEIDFTEETRTLASLQILLQSSTAALAQANIIPQTLLQLLA